METKTATIDRVSALGSEIGPIKSTLQKHEAALKEASQTALKQSELFKKHDSLIKADRINIQNLTDSVHGVIKESTERFIETDSRVEQLEKENKILKYAVGASAVKAERKSIYTDLQALNYLYDVQYSKKQNRFILKRLQNDTFKDIPSN